MKKKLPVKKTAALFLSLVMIQTMALGAKAQGISAFSVIQAEDYTSQSGIQTQTCQDTGGGLNLDYIDDGDYTEYDNIDFGSGALGFQVRAAAPFEYGYVQIVLDNINNAPVGSCAIRPTGDWQVWSTFECPVSQVTGVHNVYLKFKVYGCSYRGFNVNYFTFLQRQGVDTVQDPVGQFDSTSAIDPSITQRDNQSDTWAATDALGRTLPTNATTGGQRSNKTVGLFYFLCNNNQTGQVYDNTQILAANPSNPQYGPFNTAHYWSQPYLGYYRSNEDYVIRKHAEMLSDAGVDVIFLDVSNGILYEPEWMRIFTVYDQIRKEGGKTPQIAFFCGIDSGVNQTELQTLFKDLYEKNIFQELIFKWQGKPLILADKSVLNDSNATVDGTDLRNYFNFRKCWAWSGTTWFGNGQDKWTWLDNYPQNYGWDQNSSKPEEVSVCVAQHATTNIGRSYHSGSEPSSVTTQMTQQGLNFSEQWSRALQVDPDFIFITGWNEWSACRYCASGGETFLGKTLSAGDSYFVDEYDEEYSRDIEPENGALGDDFYYQMTGYIRQYKGTRAAAASTGQKTINISGDFSQWDSVGPGYYDTLNDTTHRNSMSVSNEYSYVNSTGRNDFDTTKVTTDSNYVYFYAKTKSNITSPAGNNWMTLLLNTDNNSSTGWNGYDYIVNHTLVNSTTGYLAQNSGGGWSWTNTAQVPFTVSGNQIMFAIPKSQLNLNTTGKVSFQFKWVDNIPDSGNIMNFIDNGDAAPDQRFNYVYTESNAKNGRLEAESATLSGGANINSNHSGYSGSGFVDNWGASGAVASFQVSSTIACTKNLTIGYANGSGGTQTLSVYVNGSKAGQVSFPVVSSANWNAWSTVAQQIRLFPGTNTVTVCHDSGDTGSVNIDYVQVDPAASLQSSGSLRYEAEDGQFSGSAGKATDHTGYSGSGFVAGLSSTGSGCGVMVSANATGKCVLTFRYANGMGNNRTMSLYIDGQKACQMTFPSVAPADWNQWGTVTQTGYLSQGDHTVTLRQDAGDSGSINLDCVDVQQFAAKQADGSMLYEAEGGQLIDGTSVAANHLSYSGTGFVQGWEDVGSTDTMTVSCDSTANYALTVRYAAGAGIDRTLSLYVNGQKVSQLYLPATGASNWDEWGVATVNAALNQGDNTITLSHDSSDSGTVNIDSVDVVSNGSQLYEAENGQLGGGLTVASDHLYYTGTGFAAGFGSTGASDTITVSSASAANYALKVKYACGAGSAGSLSLYVNGQKISQLSFPSLASSNWDKWGLAVADISLNQGSNTIMLRRDSGDAGGINVDSFYLKPLANAMQNGTVTYEAEDGACSGGAYTAADHAGYSGGGFTAGWDSSGAANAMLVSSPSASGYSLTISYASGAGYNRTMSLYVNGIKQSQLSLPATSSSSWDVWGKITATVNLNQGNNTIVLKHDSGDSGAVNIDCVNFQKS